MKNFAQTDDRRESYRCAINESKQAVELRAGEEWIHVELLDESAGGFGVRADRPLGVSTGDLVQLRLGDECFEVRVMSIVEQAPSGDPEEPVFRLGLKRVGEIFLETAEKRPWFEWFTRSRRQQPFGSMQALLGGVLIFAVLAGATPVVVIYLLDSHGIADVAFGSHAGVEPGEAVQSWNSSGTSDDSSKGNHKTVKRSWFGTKPSSTEPRLNERWDASLSLLLDRANFQTDIGKWSDAVLSVVANLVEKLSLTNPQKEEVGGILQHADEEITRLNVPDPDNTPQKVARERVSILETAHGKLVQVFTDTQRMRWDELVEKWGETLQSPADSRENGDQVK